MFPELTRHTRVLEIVGDTIRVRAEGTLCGYLVGVIFKILAQLTHPIEAVIRDKRLSVPLIS